MTEVKIDCNMVNTFHSMCIVIIKVTGYIPQAHSFDTTFKVSQERWLQPNIRGKGNNSLMFKQFLSYLKNFFICFYFK